MNNPFKLNPVFLWVGMFGCMLMGLVLEGGHLATIIQPSAAVIVFGPVLTFGLYFYGIKGLFKFVARTFRNDMNGTDREFIDKSATIGFLFGAIGVIFGMIHVMSNLSNPSLIGSGIAVAFVSAIYGAIPALLWVPLRAKDLKAAAQPKLTLKRAAGYATFTAMVAMGGLFSILYALSIVHWGEGKALSPNNICSTPRSPDYSR